MNKLGAVALILSAAILGGSIVMAGSYGRYQVVPLDSVYSHKLDTVTGQSWYCDHQHCRAF